MSLRVSRMNTKSSKRGSRIIDICRQSLNKRTRSLENLRVLLPKRESIVKSKSMPNCRQDISEQDQRRIQEIQTYLKEIKEEPKEPESPYQTLEELGFSDPSPLCVPVPLEATLFMSWKKKQHEQLIATLFGAVSAVQLGKFTPGTIFDKAELDYEKSCLQLYTPLNDVVSLQIGLHIK
jgi:hypothetical protein